MSSDDDVPPSFSNQPRQYPLNSKIMIAAIVVLFVVVFFILSLHVYAKWFWRHSSVLRARSVSWRRRRRLDFTGQEAHIARENVGLDKAVIDSIPMFVYTQPQTDEAVLECAVCLCDFVGDEKGRLLPNCNHSFHIECIDMWFLSHSTCPLCRTNAKPEVAPQYCNASKETTSSSLPPQHSAVSQDQRLGQSEAVEVISDSSPEHSTENREDAGPSVQNQSIPYPTRLLFWGDHVQVNSRLSSPTARREFSSTRSLPRMATDMPSRRTADAFASSRCLSLNLTRCPSENDRACSFPREQPLKSPPSLGVSIKRFLSREKKIFPSGQEGAEFDQDTAISPV